MVCRDVVDKCINLFISPHYVVQFDQTLPSTNYATTFTTQI